MDCFTATFHFVNEETETWNSDMTQLLAPRPHAATTAC